MTDADNIEEICQRFRTALENSQTKPFYSNPSPRGWCGRASRALGVYLLECGYTNIHYVSGYWEGMSHAWLEYNGLIIDITADQFDNCDKKVIVLQKSPFHEAFDIDYKREVFSEDALQYPENWIISLIKA